MSRHFIDEPSGCNWSKKPTACGIDTSKGTRHYWIETWDNPDYPVTCEACLKFKPKSQSLLNQGMSFNKRLDPNHTGVAIRAWRMSDGEEVLSDGKPPTAENLSLQMRRLGIQTVSDLAMDSNIAGRWQNVEAGWEVTLTVKRIDDI